LPSCTLVVITRLKRKGFGDVVANRRQLFMDWG
jgi:hypothetical protein